MKSNINREAKIATNESVTIFIHAHLNEKVNSSPQKSAQLCLQKTKALSEVWSY